MKAGATQCVIIKIGKLRRIPRTTVQLNWCWLFWKMWSELLLVSSKQLTVCVNGVLALLMDQCPMFLRSLNDIYLCCYACKMFHKMITFYTIFFSVMKFEPSHQHCCSICDCIQIKVCVSCASESSYAWQALERIFQNLRLRDWTKNIIYVWGMLKTISWWMVEAITWVNACTQLLWSKHNYI